ncbi:PLP-dependent aminotransferase family protein [Variovorax sp. LG9.2]|jgi:DNA-binding transcriptional MocR family regulator|uniref:aminotransferase-like domain-containing protein n=1 Tax=Variovorax sp. LG9.2 TaxID=3048626 RepID=UPI002B23E428|nr:PLP-dependent aminotransferase family protein [Variovorax sp. LG9.2]MEB0055709.1 PLP-dependent aminotransferase family protein [Variovorax sp. LG9.2]
MIYELIQNDLRPRYRGVVQAVIQGIEQFKLLPGQQLPTQRDLATELDMAVATVGRAYSELESQGFITSQVGRGTFVTAQRAASWGAASDAAAVIEMGIYRVPVPPLKAPLDSVLKALLTGSTDAQVFDGAPAAGRVDHRLALNEWVQGFGIGSTPDQLIVTNGGQHAAMCAISTLTHAGDLIATEMLTDPRMKSIVGYLDRRLVGIVMDEDGLIPDSLDAICREERVAAIYCTPRCQNPTNATLSMARRQELVDVARRHDIPIVESDIYGTVMPPDGILPIAALAPERTHFLTSLGRILGPGMKIGCVVSPLSAARRMQAGVAMSTGFATPIAAEIAARWIRDGTVEGMTQWQRAELRRRASVVSHFPLLATARAHPMSPHIWLTLPEPWRAEDFVDAAAAHKIAIAPTHSFVVGRRSLPHAVRLCIGSPANLIELEAACERLERILMTSPRISQDAG